MMTMLLAVALTAAPAVEPWKTTPLPGAMPAASKQGLAEVNGIKLFFASYGSGEPVFLLHGGAGNGDQWANQVPALAAKFHVIVVDARGHGRSTRDAKPMSYALMADDLLAPPSLQPTSAALSSLSWSISASRSSAISA